MEIKRKGNPVLKSISSKKAVFSLKSDRAEPVTLNRKKSPSHADDHESGTYVISRKTIVRNEIVQLRIPLNLNKTLSPQDEQTDRSELENMKKKLNILMKKSDSETFPFPHKTKDNVLEFDKQFKKKRVFDEIGGNFNFL